MKDRPVRVVVIGLGGFAGAHHNSLKKLEAEGRVQLVATCDPRPQLFADQMADWEFESRGVVVFDDYLKMLDSLAGSIDLAIIPTPIPLHAEMHRRCVQAGIAVYLEKPPTLDPSELEHMIRDQEDARFATHVGFNYIIQPLRQELKSRILEGEFGDLQEVRFEGQWARLESYFSRNDWAGRLFTQDGRLLLDSCLGNAMAHFAHNALFWSGQKALYDWGCPTAVRSALFRAHDIEGADTVFLEAAVENAVTVRLGMSHATHGAHTSIEEVICEKACLRLSGSTWSGEIRWNDGRVESLKSVPFEGVLSNQRMYCAYLRGEKERPATRLEDARPFVHLNALAYAAAAEITDFSEIRVPVRRIPCESGSTFRSVEGLPDVLRSFVQGGTWPLQWNPHAGGRTVSPDDLAKVPELVRELKGRVC